MRLSELASSFPHIFCNLSGFFWSNMFVKKTLFQENHSICIFLPGEGNYSIGPLKRRKDFRYIYDRAFLLLIPEWEQSYQ